MSVLTALLFGVTGTLASASVAAKSSKPAYGGTVNLQLSPSTLDFLGTTSTQQVAGAGLPYLIYGQLHRDNPKGALSNDLATGYIESPDGLTITIPLRHGVRFQDNTPFTAAAVAINLNRDEHGDASGICPCSTFLGSIKSITTKGPYTVVLHLSHTLATPCSTTSSPAERREPYIVSPTALAKEGEQQFGAQPVGAGPYRVSSFVSGTSGTLNKFAASYEAKAVHIQTINWTKISVDSSWIAGCQAQTVSVCSFSEANISGDPGAISSSVPGTLHEIDSPRVYWTRIQFNVYAPPFNNQVAREAIQEATDPSQLLSIVAGKPSVTCGLIASGNEFYWGSSCPAGVPTYNPAAAAKLVASLPGGTLNLTVTTNDNTTVYSQAIPALAKEWSAIPGITVKQAVVPHSTEVANQANGSFQMIAPGPGGGFVDPVLGAQPYIGAGSPQNAYGYKSSALDALLTRVETAKSPAQEASLWKAYNALDLKMEGDLGLYQGTTQNWVNNAIHNLSFSGYDVYYDQAWCAGGVCTG